MLKGAVLLVAVLALVESASLSRDGGYQCTQGVEYWCSSVERAEECGATEYCTEYVWVVNEVEEVGDSSMTCAACEYIADQALKMLEKEESEAQILVVLEGLCDKIPFVGSECHKYVAEMGPTVLKMLEGMVSADKICQTLKLCTVMENFDLENDFVKFITAPKLGDSDKCKMCVDGLKELQIILKDSKMLDIIEAVTTLFCDNFPLPQCQSLMDEYIIKYIKMAEDWDVKSECVKTKACAALQEDNLTDAVEAVEEVEEVEGTPECDACIDGVKELKKVWVDEDTQAIVKIVINEACVVLGVPESTCSLVSGLVLPQLTSAIAGLVPKDTCVKVGACTAATELGLLPFDDDSFPCEFCEFMGEQAIRRLLTNKTEKALIATAKKVCSKVPLFSVECSNAVDQYGLAFLNKVRDTDFHYMCGKFMLCDPEIQEWVKSLSLYKAIVSEEVGTEECDACMDGIDEIKEIFTDDDTQALIHVAIEALCDSLNPKIPACEKVLKMTFDGFLMQLAKLDNHDICAQAGMCPAEGLTAPIINDNSFTCEYCEFIGDQVVKRVFNNETETIILAYTKQVCAKIPSFLGNECSALVDEYGYYYLEELKKVLDIEHACEKFNLCTPAGKLFLESSELVKVMLGQETSDGLMCDACEKGLQYALGYLQSPEIQATMKSYALQVCSMWGMPDNVCEGVVAGLIEGLEKELSSFEPKIACVAFNMCDAPVYPMKEMFTIAKETFPCDVCEFIGDEFVERVLTYETVTKVLAIARQTCAYVPLFSQECTDFIDESGEDQVYKWISYINVNKLCSKIHLCQPSNKTLETLPPLPDQLEGFICDTCEFFGHEFIDRLLTANTVNGAVVVAKKVCSVIPLYSQECISFIDGQGAYWMNLWISELDADNFCSKLTLCPARNGTVLETAAELNPLAASIQCDTCMFVGNEFVEKAFTDDNIAITLNIGKAICSKVPVFSKECAEFIDSDGEELLHTLISMVHVDQICSMIKACPAKAVSDIFPDPDAGFICDTCEYFGHEFIQRILTKENRQKTLSVARKGCAYVPLYSAECQKFIDEDGDYFLQTWISSLSVDRFCSKIHLCKPDLVEESIAESLGLSASIQCDVCMFVGNEFVEKAFTDETIGFAIMLAHEACAYVPVFSKECIEAVEQDGERLIRMALSHVHIEQICGEIHLCPKTLEETLPNPNQGFVCDTCQYFGHEFVERVLTKEARRKTLDVVRKACSVIPLYSNECQKVVDEQGDYYLNMWIDKLDMDGLCMKLQLCNPAFKTWYETSAIPQLLESAKLPDCDTCVEGFDELKKILHDPYTKDLLVVVAKEACLSLPIPFCNSVMTRVFAHIEAAVDAINSESQCKKMGVCPGRVTEQEDKFNVMLASLSPLLTPAVTESTCDTCVEVMEDFKEKLADPYTRELMHKMIEGLCDGVDHIPGCQMMLNPLLDWILKIEIDSNKWCSFFGVCSTPKFALDITSTFCDECVEGLDEVKEMMTEPTMRLALKTMAEEFCTYAAMPVSMCNYGVDTFIDMVVDKLAKIDSTNTCSFFGVCSANPMTSVTGDDWCADCIDDVDEWKSVLPYFKESFHLVSMEICTVIPFPGCSMFFNKIFDYSFDKFASMESKSICSAFGVCSAKPIASVAGSWCEDCVEGLDDFKAALPVVKESMHLVSMEICTQIPFPGCAMIFNKIFDYAFDKLAAMDSQSTCSLIGVCSAKPITIVTDGYCEDCIEGMDEFKEIFADPLIRESMHLVSTEICNSLPIPGCVMIMNKIFDVTIDKLSSIDSKHTCSFFGVCSANPLGGGPADEICEVCVEGFEELKEVMLDPTMKMAMKAMVGEVCQTLPIPMCQYILNSYIDTVISSVASIDSNATCALVGACGGQYSNAGVVVRAVVKALPLGSAPCDMCTAQVDEIKKMAADPAVIAVVKETVDEVCAMLPIVGQACKTTLETYIDEAAEAVIELDSKAICSYMGMC